jgi:uncharacterized phage infection (PIP) family protein YhgE
MYKQDGIESGDEENMFEKEDSILVIINEPVSENIESNIENMYHKGLDELSGGLNPVLEKEMKENKFENLENEVHELIKLSQQLKEVNEHLSKKNLQLSKENNLLSENLEVAKDGISRIIKKYKSIS